MKRNPPLAANRLGCAICAAYLLIACLVAAAIVWTF